jgi:hypothetical protein
MGQGGAPIMSGLSTMSRNRISSICVSHDMRCSGATACRRAAGVHGTSHVSINLQQRRRDELLSRQVTVLMGGDADEVITHALIIALWSTPLAPPHRHAPLQVG